MTHQVDRKRLAEMVARRMLSDMCDYGGVEGFCEKLTEHPEQYTLDLAFSALDCIGLGGCLHPRVQ